MPYRTAAALMVLGLWTLVWIGNAQDLSGTTVSFQFREPYPTTYQVQVPQAAAASKKEASLPRRLNGTSGPSSGEVTFGTRIALQLKHPEGLDLLIQGRPLKLARRLNDRTFILEADDAWTALKQAADLATNTEVAASFPVARRPKQLYSPYAARPNDPYFFQPDLPNTEWQAYLENRDTNGMPLGVDLNVRAAWAVTRGQGITLAIGDDGVDLDHPDLAAQSADTLHLNFYDRTTNGFPAGALANHGTAVAGLAAAAGNNHIGISGVAPGAKIASWVLFNAADGLSLSDEDLMDMFQYQSNVVSVQNHSWGKSTAELYPINALEDLAISNAVTFGREGRGVIFVRAAGNGRNVSFSANDDGYTSDFRAIVVAAARLDGRVAGYSSPGACILVAAPSGDSDEDELNPCLPPSPNLITTDRRGDLGYNFNTYTNDLADYVFGDAGFSGTSASAPQITGLAALILSANPGLTYRDVQQILVLSSRHYDLSDPDLATNAAGFRVSHNLGFGVPDAGVAVTLARSWSNRPPAVSVTYSNTESQPIPPEGLRLLVTGTNVPEQLQSIQTTPAWGGPFADQPTPELPVADIGQAMEPLTQGLAGRAALIQRGGNFFCEKLRNAAIAGAAFAVVYNNEGSTARMVMRATDYAALPGVFISEVDGESLRDYLSQDPSARGQLKLYSLRYTFSVPETLLCEHVLVKVDSDYSTRGDLRITLISPRGTRSVLQHINDDVASGPRGWTFCSTHHFFESSAGVWTVEISNLGGQGTGSVNSVGLTVLGTPIQDSDADGLDDRWEMDYFHTLAFGPQDDPDQDGLSNAREQIMGTDPNAPCAPFQLDLSVWDQRLVRLSWPSSTNVNYRIRAGGDATTPLAPAADLDGKFLETEWFTPFTNVLQFFRVEEVPVKAAQ